MARVNDDSYKKEESFLQRFSPHMAAPSLTEAIKPERCLCMAMLNCALEDLSFVDIPMLDEDYHFESKLSPNELQRYKNAVSAWRWLHARDVPVGEGCITYLRICNDVLECCPEQLRRHLIKKAQELKAARKNDGKKFSKKV